MIWEKAMLYSTTSSWKRSARRRWRWWPCWWRGIIQNICWRLRGCLSADSLSNIPPWWDFIYDNSLPWLGPIWGLWHKLHAKFSTQERVDQFTEARKKDFGFFLKLNPLPGLCVHPLQCQGLFPSNGKWNSPNRKENLSVQDHRCLAPNDIANLWKTVNRIRIIMGEFVGLISNIATGFQKFHFGMRSINFTVVYFYLKYEK